MAKPKAKKTSPPAPVRPRPDVGFDDIVERLQLHGRPYDREFLAGVYEYTEEMHRDQRRKSGEPYVIHPTYVAYLLADLKLDQVSVAVGLLHDVLEDTLITRDELRERFGEEITALVDGVTKIGKQSYVRRDEAQAESFRKMILASAKDLRVILVKLADRLHNMMTLEHMKPESRRRISRETLEIYAPIALRLGMSKVQGDLEDLAFFHLYPHIFAELEAELREKMRMARGSHQQIARRLKSVLSNAGIDAEISFRVKRFHSIYRKMMRQGIDLSQLYDYLAFRIITDDLKDTYAAFGVVHQNWRPIPGRFKDYIAMPKPNLYQSLHTTVLGSGGHPFEVQIRTKEMDLVAEEGIAAHWQYKEGQSGRASNDQNILWLRQLLEWQKEVNDPREFLNALKIDLYPDEVYAFTPKGDVYAFPRGATPLDFAYRIHTDLGHHCSGARVNGKLVPLKTPLRNGDMVEIMSAANRKPSRDWLKMVVTSRAKSKIRHWINTEQKEESIAVGRRLLERELKKIRLSPRKVFEGEKMAAYLESEGWPRIEDLFMRIGYGKVPIKRALSQLVEKERLEEEQAEQSTLRRVVDRALGQGPLLVKGEGDMLAFLAKCCDPVPGEELIGYVTRGRGISVHSEKCPNIVSLSYDADRLVEVDWARQSKTVFPVSLVIETEDQTGMLARLTELIAKEASNIRRCEAGTDTGMGVIRMVVEVRNRRHLERLKTAIRSMKGVLAVIRQRSGGSYDGKRIRERSASPR